MAEWILIEKDEDRGGWTVLEKGLKFKGGDIPDKKFDRKQLTIGTEIETEHTDNRDIAKMIAKAHLSESPLYYVYLSEMEKKMTEVV